MPVSSVRPPRLLPSPLITVPDPVAVRTMFAGIAGRYDLVNRVLSGGVDRRWRKRVVARAGSVEGKTIVDVACGTGDLAAVFARAGANVLGVDFTFEMVALAPGKTKAVRDAPRPVGWIQGDGLELPLADDSADVVTIAFGLRNVADRHACLREMARVTRPGGRVIVLEFSMPDTDAFGRLYRGYLEHVLPRIGGALSGDRTAYAYLDDTVQNWPDPDRLQSDMQGAGYVKCGHERLWRGIACLHWGDVALPAGKGGGGA